MKIKYFSQSVAIFSVLALSACGGEDGVVIDNGSGQASPTASPTAMPTEMPTTIPTSTPSATPSPTTAPSPLASPSVMPSIAPSPLPSAAPGTSASPISLTQTDLGLVYTANGSVDILRSVDLKNTIVDAHNLSDVTLYTSREDSIDVSNCNDLKCLVFWHPLLANDNDNAEPPYSIINRSDGLKQWGLRGMPVYLSRLDRLSAGDMLVNLRKRTIALAQPIRLSDDEVNTDAGIYLTAAGRVQTSSPEAAQSTARFIQSAGDKRDMSLYTFDLDSPGMSNCNDACLSNWPALLADINDHAIAPYSLIQRKLGSNGQSVKQWALNGKPLYFYTADKNPGDINGHTLANWRLARPVAVQSIGTNADKRIVAAGEVMQAVYDGEEVLHRVAKHNFALYTYSGDTTGKSSTCTEDCLNDWPALMAFKGAQASPPYSLIARENGKLQWAINGMPLYLYEGDSQADDTNGNGVNNTWQLARP